MLHAERSEMQSLVVVLLISALMIAAFIIVDWRSFVTDPLPAFLNDQSRETDGEALNAFAEAANNAIDFLITIQFGLFFLAGVAVRDSFSHTVSANWVRIFFVSGFFFFTFLSSYYAYLGYQAILTQIGNKIILVNRIDTVLSYQAMFLAVAALFSFALAGVSLLRFSSSKQRIVEGRK